MRRQRPDTLASAPEGGRGRVGARIATSLLGSAALAQAGPAAAADGAIFVVSAESLSAKNAPVVQLSEPEPPVVRRAPGLTVVAALSEEAAAQAQRLGAAEQYFETVDAEANVLQDTDRGSVVFDPLSDTDAFEPAGDAGERDLQKPEEAIVASPDSAEEGPEEPAVAAPPLGESEVLFEADLVTRESETSPIVAVGAVRAYFGARYLRADKLIYDPTTDIVVAEGNVSITDSNMETAFAGRVELTGDLRDGVAENFSALLAESARLASDSAIREQGARTRLKKAVFTACKVCKTNGEGKIPTWRIKALRVTRDEERKVVRFYHAFFELKGVPVLYSPFLQAPDPSVERQSGFLTPVIGASSRLGFNLEVPYYLAISNHQDATFYPKYTSNDGVLWQGEYRRRDVSGRHVIQAGVIDFDNSVPDATGNLPVDVPGVRWHVFTRGNREIGDNWNVGYDIERVSDDTYLRNYNIHRRGDLRQEINTSSANRLRSNAFVTWSSGGTVITADGYLFQGLRTNDDSALTPFVLPLLNLRHDFADDIFGGRAHINANFASLQRTGGVDTRRFTASGFWEREYITPNGHRFNAFAEMRADAYYFHDLDEGTEILPGVAGDPTNFDARFAPSVGLEWSYPLTRRTGVGRLLIEPRVQLVASPTGRNTAAIINEDSQSIEFDFPGLFEYNKSTGYDRFEDGQRMNVGVTTSAFLNNGIAVEASIGSQLRLQSSAAFDPATGLGEKRADLVGALNVRYKNLIGVENRFRIDDDTGSIQRAESMAFLRIWKVNGRVSYVRLNEENAAAALLRREELTGSFRFRATKNWSATFGWRENLLTNSTIRQTFGIGYTDDCATIDIIYSKDRTRDVGLGPDNSIIIRFTLKSLGGFSAGENTLDAR